MIERKEELNRGGPYCSDTEANGDQSANLKRQKMSEEERLTRCRERNRLHAKVTRERKKSHMDCLVTRIEDLVDEKKRLNSTASETSVASILMSLSSIEKNAGITGLNFNSELEYKNDSVFAYKIESDDDTSDPVEMLKNKISLISNNEDYKDVLSLAMTITKEKPSCSSSELEEVRREKNRMHAKQTRLKKKKMTQEMEVIISNLEREVGDLQSGLISMFPNPKPEDALHFMNNSLDARDYAKLALNSRTLQSPDANKGSNRESSAYWRETNTPFVDSSPTATHRKRKHLAPLDSSVKDDLPVSAEITIKPEGNEERDTKLLWRQHISKNTVKTVSLCSESNGSLSEGSGSEGDLRSAGSAVHSLLHIGVTSSSSSSRGSGSGSDESDTASSKHSTPLAPANTVTSRTQSHSIRLSESRFESTAPIAKLDTSPHHAFSFASRPKSIQHILAACAPVESVSRKVPYWRLPERSIPCYSHSLAGPIAAAVASIYPTINIESGNTGPYKGYLPMTGDIDVQSNTQDSHVGMRSQDFTVYDGNKNRIVKSEGC